MSHHAQVIKRQADIRRRYCGRTEDQIRADRARLHPRGTKTCRECREVLTLASFYRARQSPDGHLDHVIPKRLGGTDDPENLVVSCERCNLSKLGSRLQDRWPRHFVEHLRRTLPVPTRAALLDLLATHRPATDELLRAEREAADL